jgi:G3E family GTPase
MAASLSSSVTDERVPVTVITGFLGSGKTTLLNRILNFEHGKRIAVIENEFGEVGIDDSLVSRKLQSKEEIFEMNNGCICCTVRGDLIRILTKLLSRSEPMDAIIIETTGMADPAPVAQTFFVSEEIKARARLDGIITLVDAKHLILHLDEEKPEGAENEAQEQLLFADKIILNKLDLVDNDEKAQVIARIRELNRSANIIECEYSNINIPDIINMRAFDLEKVLEMDSDFLNIDATHVHDESVTSVGIQCEGSLNLEKLNQWFTTLLKEQGVNIYRMKGVISIHNLESKYVFQGVHMMFTGEPLEAWKEGEVRSNKLVFIGRHLNRSAIESGFNSCMEV